MAVEQVGKCAVLLESLLTDINALSNPQDFLTFRHDFGFANGTGANQADKRWSSAGRSLAGTTSENLDLAGGLTDYRGNVITFARIRGIAIFNNAAIGASNLIQVGGAASNAFINWVANSSDIVNVRPQGVLLLMAPDATAYAVTAGTGDILMVKNSAVGTITYDIALLGASS
jgi:hypothetical protein